MEHSHITMDEDRYRCIMWEKVVEEEETKIYLSISGDASCNGLFSTREGRALVLYQGLFSCPPVHDNHSSLQQPQSHAVNSPTG